MGERGFATVQHVAAVALALVFFTLLANLIVMQYVMGAVTGALDEAVRIGARTEADPVGACERRISESIGAVLSGPVAAGINIDCRLDGDLVRAEASGVLSGWLPAVPDVSFRRTALAPREPFEVP